MTPAPIYTVGHSNRSGVELMAMLAEAGIATLVDIRAHPHSRRNPQFHTDALRALVEQAGMRYHWAGRQLGGRRAPRPNSPHVALVDDGLRGYADHMDGEAFQKSAAQLLRLAQRAPTAVLCAEREPEGCHRAMLSDYLTLADGRVVHVIDLGLHREHRLRPEARRESARLVYDRLRSGALDLG